MYVQDQLKYVRLIILCLGRNSKDKAYKLSAEYPFRPDSVKAVLSIANTLYNQRSLDVSTCLLNLKIW